MVRVKFCCRPAEGEQQETVELPETCLSGYVSGARLVTANQLGLSPDSIDLVHRGRLLEDTELLSSYQVRPCSVLYALRKPASSDTAGEGGRGERAASSSDVTHLHLTLKTAALSPAYRRLLQGLSRPEVLNALLSKVPGLAEDPMAVGILQDPYLLLQLTDPSDLQKLAERHPCLVSAAPHLSAALRDQSRPSGSRDLTAPGPANYSIDSLSDDEEPREGQQAAPAPAPAPAGPVTAAQLASALSASAQQPSGGGAISAAMVSAAVQQALAALPSPAPGPAPAAESQVSEAAVRQILDLGITSDERRVRRALHVSGGDVNQAVEFLYSSAYDQ